MNALIWIAVAVVVVVLLLLLAGAILKRGSGRRNQERLAQAERLRGEAADRVPDVESATQRAQVADVHAGRARAEAEQAERVAADAHRDLAHEQAAQEAAVREADQLDPRVDTSADDYRPITGPDMKAATVATDGAEPGPADETPDAARHRAD